ncbi:type II secretion system protein N [Ottowia testudinis]|uniref:Type II secretion system protein N n=1 Tax=Ottowia testudinis TaxID=2816950 RepID=A0A975CI33_9BURK|nr:type II secretion system protein N [Ottowia testudinis]QTD46221.1 type II secretion system protein N [Ottowia testudinis]
MRRAAPAGRVRALPANRPPWGWALAGALLGLLLVGVLAAPARWLAAGVARGTAGMVQLAEPQGSLWNGSARLLLTGGAGSQDRVALPGRVQWRLRPALGGLALAMTADCCTPTDPLALRINPRWGGARVELQDAQTLWPAALLAGLGTPFNTIQPQGELALATQGLAAEWRAGRASLTGGAELTLRHVSSRLSTLQPLGSYRVQLQGGDAPGFTLSTLEGALQMSGAGQWVGGRLRFSGEATATPEHQAQLANLLNLLGRRQGDRAIMSFG